MLSKNNGRGHLYDDSFAPSLDGKNSEIVAREVKIEVSKLSISLEIIEIDTRPESDRNNCNSFPKRWSI